MFDSYKPKKVKPNWKKIIHNCINLLRSMKVDPEELAENVEDFFPKQQFFHKGSKEFINAAKSGQLDKMKELVYKYSRFLAHDYDALKQTPLHWAAKRNHPDIIHFLVD